MDGYPPYANLVYDVATMSWVRMTQPLVDSLTSNIYLAVDGVEGQLSTISNQLTSISGYTDGVESLLTTIRNNSNTELDGAPRDAFQRLRISQATSLFDTSFEYQISTNEWTTTVAAGGTVSLSTVSGMVSLDVTSASTSSAILQTLRYHRYQPGKSQLVLMTGVIGSGVGGVIKRVGIFDANNGLFFEQVGTNAYFIRRSDTSGSVYDDPVDQTQWNIDTLDGNGVSGKTLNVDKTNILLIDFQWLGVGRVRMGFDIDGVVCYAHEFLNAGNLTVPYMRTPNLPLRYEIYKTGDVNTASLKAICCSVVSEGGIEFTNANGYAVSATTGRTVATRRAFLSIRPKATFGGLVNRGRIDPLSTSVLGTGTNIVTLIELVYNPTFQTSSGSLTWTSANAASIVEYSVHGDANAGAFTGGDVVESFIIAGTNTQRASQLQQLAARFPLVLDAAGANPRALSLVATDVTGTATVYGTVTWNEVR
jgi:hypothetical protein